MYVSPEIGGLIILQTDGLIIYSHSELEKKPLGPGSKQNKKLESLQLIGIKPTMRADIPINANLKAFKQATRPAKFSLLVFVPSKTTLL